MRLKVLFAGALLTLLALAAVASAGTKTKVFIDRVDPAVGGLQAEYKGHISSKKDKCLGGRKITLIHDSDPPFEIGTAETDDDGNWTITGNYPGDPRDDELTVTVAKDGKCKGKSNDYNFYSLPGAPPVDNRG